MTERKLISYCLFTYNQEQYIEEAIAGAVSQSYPNLEIIISDDCSSDRTFSLVEHFALNYEGPHTIVINRNERNLGIGAHFSHVLYNLSHGDYLIVLGGDDISNFDHAEKAVEYIEESDVELVDFNADVIDENGKWVRVFQDLNFSRKRYALDDYLRFRKVLSFAPGRIFTRNLLNHFHPITAKCPTEDSVLVLRSLLVGGFLRVNEKLVRYRIHQNNISGSVGVSKLSHLSIISQFVIDVLKLYTDNKLTDELTQKILNRLRVELIMRNIIYRRFKNSSERLIMLIKYKIINCYFKIISNI